MSLNMTKEVAVLERMTVGELHAWYVEVFGETVRSRHRQYLIRRIVWRLQANAEGGLSERALRRAEELANVADVRVVLFGGDVEDGQYAGDTWAWDGSVWEELPAFGPSPRRDAAMVYDSSRGRMVLFGGYDGANNGESWEYRGDCTNREQVRKARCEDHEGANRLKVILGDGAPGDSFTITLSSDGAEKSGAINSRGKGKARFNDRPAGDGGVASAEWGCGAVDTKEYACP